MMEDVERRWSRELRADVEIVQGEKMYHLFVDRHWQGEFETMSEVERELDEIKNSESQEMDGF